MAVLPAVLLVLHGVEEDEQVGGCPLRQIAEPRQILRLVDRDPHGCLTKIGLLSRRAPPPRASRRKTAGRPSHVSRCVARNGVEPLHAAITEPLRTNDTRTSAGRGSTAATATVTSSGAPGAARSGSPGNAPGPPAGAANSPRPTPPSRPPRHPDLPPPRGPPRHPAGGGPRPGQEGS